MIEIREYLTEDGKSPFGRWFSKLNAPAAAKVTVALERMAGGNLSNLKAVGSGVSEYRIDFGPGYRLYLGQDGETLIILLSGGIKKRQQQDIQDAQVAWQQYRTRKAEEEKIKREGKKRGTD